MRTKSSDFNPVLVERRHTRLCLDLYGNDMATLCSE